MLLVIQHPNEKVCADYDQRQPVGVTRVRLIEQRMKTEHVPDDWYPTPEIRYRISDALPLKFCMIV